MSSSSPKEASCWRARTTCGCAGSSPITHRAERCVSNRGVSGTLVRGRRNFPEPKATRSRINRGAHGRVTLLARHRVARGGEGEKLAPARNGTIVQSHPFLSSQQQQTNLAMTDLLLSLWCPAKFRSVPLFSFFFSDCGERGHPVIFLLRRS